MANYNPHEIENKWKKYWEENQLHNTDLNSDKPKLYSLVMFSYPSNNRLHLGHWYNYAPTDTWTRMKKMQGYEVFEPMGFDSFGLPAENYAIKMGIHPEISTTENIEFMIEQLKGIGAAYDWNHTLSTCSPEYYKWTQWIFLQLYKNNLAYRKKAPVNWCPDCQTVLANEQVEDGCCERCKSEVTKKDLVQWFFKITDYADRLLSDLEELDWPETTKKKQQWWIGRSEGAGIDFQIANTNQNFTVFTTRPDTLFGVTYVVLAPEHEMVSEITTSENLPAVSAYIEAARKQTEIERMSTVKEKTGVFTGAFAINPVNNEKIPVWIGDYVLASYGTGAVMAVPGHDQRDFEFALKYDLPIRKVILQPGTNPDDKLTEAWTETGTIINSGKYNGLNSDDFIPLICDDLQKAGQGKRTINFKLRDWLVSRQRYWGAPIPVIYCDSCGTVAVPEKDLPVLLPKSVDFKPGGESPLARCTDFINTTCPQCGKPARREADTMDTFVDSSWYFLRYPSANFDDKPFDTELTNKWLPVDQYVGGPEHSVGHLIFSRFVNKVLFDLKYINFSEPFKKLNHQGIILGPDGARMSKSKGNVVNPDDYLKNHGTDVFRTYLMFTYSFEDGGPWNDDGVAAIQKFINRVWRTFELFETVTIKKQKAIFAEPQTKTERLLAYRLHYTIKNVTNDTQKFQFNTSISRIMELTNELNSYRNSCNDADMNPEFVTYLLRNYCLLLAPFIPHLTEEIWSEFLGQKPSVFQQDWPLWDEKYLVKDEITYGVQINGKVRAEITVPSDSEKQVILETAKTHEKILKYLEGKNLVKEIVVPGKLVSLVVK